MTSAPLVLGFDLANRSLLAKNYPIIGSRAAIAINQAWAGHPGSLVKELPPNAAACGAACSGPGTAVVGVPCDPSDKTCVSTPARNLLPMHAEHV